MNIGRIFDRFKSRIRGSDSRARAFLSVREQDMPDPDERALYETVLNAAMRGEEVIATTGPDGVTVNDTHYESIDAARDAEKAKHP